MVAMASSIGQSSVTSFWSAIRTFIATTSLLVALGGARDRVAVELDAEPRRVDEPDLALARGVRSGAVTRSSTSSWCMIWLPSVRLGVLRPRWCCAASVMPLTLWPCRQTGTPAALGDGGGPAEGEQAAGLVRREARWRRRRAAGRSRRRRAGVNTAWSAAMGTCTASRTWRSAVDAEQRASAARSSRAEGLERVDHADRLGDAPGAVGVHAQAAAADGFAHGRRVRAGRPRRRGRP